MKFGVLTSIFHGKINYFKHFFCVSHSFLGLGEEGSCSWGVLMDEGRSRFSNEKRTYQQRFSNEKRTY